MYRPAESGFATYFLSMLSDGDRNDAYEAGIAACLRAFAAEQGRAPVVLDLGCGTGLLTRFCFKYGACKVVGVDTNETMIALCKRSVRDDRLTLFCGTVDDYAAEAEGEEVAFDVVVSETLGTLHTSENMPEYLRSAATYLRTFDEGKTYVVPQRATTRLRGVRPRSSLFSGWCLLDPWDRFV